MQEIETLRSKLHSLEHLRGVSDNKRARERSESELSSAATSPPDPRFSLSVKKEVKRSRDYGNTPPKVHQLSTLTQGNRKEANVSIAYQKIL